MASVFRMPLPDAESLPIAVRAYAHTKPTKGNTPKPSRGLTKPSEWVVVFDTETTTDASQRLRLGTYQVRKGDKLKERGVFFDADALTNSEIGTLCEYAQEKDLALLTVEDFVESIFFKIGYDLHATIVGFNLPFDISRLALKHSSARLDEMRGGFSFRLSPSRNRPRVQIKHLSRRLALIRFTKPAQQLATRDMRKHSKRVPTRRGFFVDVKTVAAALLSRSFSLGSLAEHLNIPHQKLETDEHGAALTQNYIAYALRDVQTTWECFAALRERYQQLGLRKTPLHKIYSEASLGKAYLRQMGIRTWRQMQPDFPPHILGNIMSTYYGGRAEVHIRRSVTQVLYCDFLSMYPTVCTCMGLWRFVIAQGMEWCDATSEIRELLDRIDLADLQKPETWQSLCAIVQVHPVGDILPVRAKYGGAPQHTIGLNHLTSETPLWYTLADCIASKLKTGKAPKVLRAIAFTPLRVQDELVPIDIAGNVSYRVDPTKEDFYRRLVDLRSSVKEAERAGASDDERDRLKADQFALKILANATSYGIFVELNAKPLARREPITCYGASGHSFRTMLDKAEEPGPYFHPLLATQITGAARLMLAIVECQSINAGLDWAFCDTDSMAIANVKGLDNDEFIQRANEIREWFEPLNPYSVKEPLLKIEDANYGIAKGKIINSPKPLYCFAVSAKRYALFNVDDRGRPILRKASAHGLGHLLPPYIEDDAPPLIPQPIAPLSDIGVERWQHDLWHCIVDAALNGHPDRPDLSELPGFDKPAVSRYAATTPDLLRWFDCYNKGRPYAEQVRPFNFLLALQAGMSWLLEAGAARRPTRPKRRTATTKVKKPRPVAPYANTATKALDVCFDRNTGDPVNPDQLKTYREVLAQYHLQPEAKFANGNYLNRGATQRRHIEVTVVHNIGKEANRLEEQSYLGLNPEAQTNYGIEPSAEKRALNEVRRAAGVIGVSAIAREANLSRPYVSDIVGEKRKPSLAVLGRLVWIARMIDSGNTKHCG